MFVAGGVTDAMGAINHPSSLAEYLTCFKHAFKSEQRHDNHEHCPAITNQRDMHHDLLSPWMHGKQTELIAYGMIIDWYVNIILVILSRQDVLIQGQNPFILLI